MDPSWTLFWLLLFQSQLYYCSYYIFIPIIFLWCVLYNSTILFSLFFQIKMIIDNDHILLGYTTIITLFHIISQSYHQIIGKHTQFHLQFSWSPQWIITYSFIHCLLLIQQNNISLNNMLYLDLFFFDDIVSNIDWMWNNLFLFNMCLLRLLF